MSRKHRRERQPESPRETPAPPAPALQARRSFVLRKEGDSAGTAALPGDAVPAEGSGDGRRRLRLDVAHQPLPAAGQRPEGDVGQANAVAAAVAADADISPPTFDRKAVLQCYLSGDHRRALEPCIEVLRFHSEHSIERLSPALREYVNSFVETVLFLLTKPDLKIERDHVLALMTGHHVLANLVGISDYKTTDPQVAIVRDQPRNFVRLMLLYSIRNQVQLPAKVFFDADPYLASLWYATYPMGAMGAVTEQLWQNLLRHLEYVDERMRAPDHRILGLYFSSTQAAPGRDRALKARWNEDLKRQIRGLRPRNTPSRDRVAIVTAKWFAGSAVYRSLYPLVETLKDRYRLTLVHLGPWRQDIDRSLFDDVRHVEMKDMALDCQSISETDFQLAFFPDIGMTAESVWLSNMRIAPIQATGYGHPATTGGSEIDYFIGGTETELVAAAEHYYTERLVLIPGLGALPTYPDYQPTYPPRQGDAVVINLPWGATKANYPLLSRLKAIQECSSRPVRLHFFPAWGLNRYAAAPLFVEGIGALFGGTATVFANRSIPEYMAIMEQGDFSLDSYPFGGFNTIIDSLHLGKPLVAQEGSYFFSRASSALLRRAGLEELVAHSEEEYIGKAVRLVEDDRYRAGLSERLRSIDLRAAVFERDDPRYFCKAIDYLIENHEALKRDGGRAPVVIR